ncbi:uncharacterized protein LOC130015273 [Mercurialis annua]|uniref:uncharacterized protein LOC130015273 n=1 Tax=Mercurialis annua TaxID=3986 RepID=UPI0024AE0D1D|nr:uncharacterized protein LOC130015273 [Mercurialis annua]
MYSIQIGMDMSTIWVINESNLKEQVKVIELRSGKSLDNPHVTKVVQVDDVPINSDDEMAETPYVNALVGHHPTKVHVDAEKEQCEDEIKWKQRSRKEWLAYGDSNTHLFHRRATRRRARNKIDGLMGSQRNWKEEPGDNTNVVQSYVQDLFESSNSDIEDLNVVTNHIEHVVDEDMNSKLCAEFIKEEVKKALRVLASTKAHGVDGFPALFYKKVLEYCWERANRYFPILGKVIDQAQSAFVPGRSIIDNALIRFECIYLINNSRKKSNGPLALKLDMAKAYDMVEWYFIESMLVKLGFNGIWVKKIMNCLYSVNFSFLINSEGLSSLINNDVAEGVLHVIIFGENLLVSHLFFVDNSLLFARAYAEECYKIVELLKVYEKASGQVVNLDKSTLSFSKGTRDSLRQHLQQILQVTFVTCHETDLGLPLVGEKGKISQLSKIKFGINCNHGRRLRRCAIGSGGVVVMVTRGFTSLLGKQCVNLNAEECLLCRIWKRKYFRNVSFLEAKSSRTGSYTWKSVLRARDVLVAGLSWRVGNGRNIYIYHDKLINRESTFKIYIKPGMDENAKVSEPITDSKEWNMVVLRNVFDEHEVKCIANSPLAITNQNDVLRWHYDKYGIYNVKSGYRIAEEIKRHASSSDNEQFSKWWKYFWKLLISSKVKIFIWRIYHEWIPMRTRLVVRRNGYEC